MKKLIILILAAITLLAACAPATGATTPTPAGTTTAPVTTEPAETTTTTTPAALGQPDITLPKVTPFMTLEEFPALDGSTANLPLMAAVMACATGISLEEAQGRVNCTTTSYAYFGLKEGAADLLLVYEAAQSTKDEIENFDTIFNLTPIGRDALVFIANERNPVNNLTTRQLQDIYTGTTTNWKDVGGEDHPITAFQREESSGSQALFMKLLMKGLTPMKAPTELYPDEMSGLIEGLAEYNNDGGALGYSVYYYAQYMYTKPGLKMIAVDGVTPREATIASGEYPFLNPFFVVTRSDEPADSPASKLAQWLATDEGRSVIKAAGYIAVDPAA